MAHWEPNHPAPQAQIVSNIVLMNKTGTFMRLRFLICDSFLGWLPTSVSAPASQTLNMRTTPRMESTQRLTDQLAEPFN